MTDYVKSLLQSALVEHETALKSAEESLRELDNQCGYTRDEITVLKVRINEIEQAIESD
jgi:peptidoglycan hydrolase CwlO-like protein